MKKLKNRLKKFCTNIIVSGMSPETDYEITRKVVLINVTIILVAFFAAGFGIDTFRKGEHFICAVDLATVTAMICIFFYLRQSKNHVASSLLCVAVVGIFFFILFVTGGIGNTGYMWTYCFPLLVFFLLGTPAGVPAIVLFVAACIAGLTVLRGFLPAAEYPPVIMTRFFGSFLAIFIVSWMYELVRRRTQDRIRQKSDDAIKTLEQLKNSEERLRDITYITSDIIWEAGGNGTFTFIGGKLKDILGYEQKDLVGRDITSIMPEEQREKFSEAFKRSVSRKTGLIDFVRWIHHKDGHRICMQTNAYPVCDDNGALHCFRGVDKDITGKQLAERERFLIENRLRVAQKMEAVGQLAGGVAHDFNNILGAISGYADMIGKLAAEKGMGKVGKYADTILAASSRAADLTGKLLAFARKGSIRIVPVDIHQIIPEIIQLLTPSLDKRITVQFHATADNPCLRGDPGQLHNLVMNLALNARDAMPEGGLLVLETSNVVLDSIFLKKHHYELIPGEYLLISVSDTGIGMTGEIKAHIFEPFFTTKEIGRGSGLGLASAYGTVKSHNGYINVYSEPNLGTTFKIYFPSIFVTGRPDFEPAHENADSSPTGTVLVVDDEQFMLDVSVEMIEMLGYTAYAFNNGAEALAFYASHFRNIDVVILDMIMPGLDGKACLKKMKAIYPDATAILATGFCVAEEMKDILGEGFAGIIQKPFVMNHLNQVISSAIRNKRG